MSNTSVQATPNVVTDPPVITIYEPKKKSLGQRVFSAFVLGVKALFLSASAAGGVALMSMGGAVCMPIGATLFGCSLFLGFLLVKRQIDAKGSKLESQIKAHASLIAAQRDSIERQEDVANLNAKGLGELSQGLGKLNEEVLLVSEVNKELEQTSHRFDEGLAVMGKLSEDMRAFLSVFERVFTDFKDALLASVKKPASSKVVNPAAAPAKKAK